MDEIQVCEGAENSEYDKYSLLMDICELQKMLNDFEKRVSELSYYCNDSNIKMCIFSIDHIIYSRLMKNNFCDINESEMRDINYVLSFLKKRNNDEMLIQLNMIVEKIKFIIKTYRTTK